MIETNGYVKTTIQFPLIGIAGYTMLEIIPKAKPCLLFSPDGSGNPFAFFFKKQKIEANSRNPCNQKMRNHSLKANILFKYQ
ncbi:hypothetical protein [Flavobacterium sp. HTF]|uniref:hypothetical protein n=1 Tax=Flavobacterium sp. HTF TaxID=2170732 RepID=UPI000D5E4694|nr:hypothetical protein [Flavobacterium sp. HTF]PWB25641.1 hypothetical protein DCO46_08290 [Flavobacterium sp. HTF]